MIETWRLVPIALAIVPLLAMVGILWFWIKMRGRTGKRNPLTRDLLRSPGESLRDQLEEQWLNTCAFMTFSPAWALMVYAMYISHVAFGGRSLTAAGLAFYVGLIALGVGYACWKVWQILKARQLLRLGYEAEVAVGQELNELVRLGYYVFHDLPAEGFNVDHVAVGPNGVFAIETKGRSKVESRDDGGEGWKVTYDGKRLIFPSWSEADPLDQAIRQAKWLRDLLRSAVGDAVPVQPVLVLPGWFINRTSGEGIPVLNGKQLVNYIPKLGSGARLENSLIQRIVHQLDQRCRDVERRAYTVPKDPS
jgi:hypothetical protein